MKRPSVLTLGTFDGVHRAHQRIIREVVHRAARTHSRSVVLAFGMPPRHASQRLLRPFLLTTLGEKVELLKRLGVQQIQVLVFDRETASTPPDRFFKDRIVQRCRARSMVVGPRVAFGKNRAGRLDLLRHLGVREGVRVQVVPPVRVAGRMVSSRSIRALLSRGLVENARRQLGYPYSVSGPVIHGARRGRRVGFPTANIDVDPRKILPKGVFWVKVLPENRPIPLKHSDLKGAVDGLCNVGTRPTFTPRSHTLHCEVFFLQGAGNLYGKRLRVVFLRRIRSEKKFASAPALHRQIERDLRKARRWML